MPGQVSSVITFSSRAFTPVWIRIGDLKISLADSEFEMTDYDSPWKEVLERYFASFTAFFFPDVHAGVDWDRGYEFLDKELQRVVRDAALGRRYAQADQSLAAGRQ